MSEGRIVVVAGGRRYRNRARVFGELSRIHEATPIAGLWHGACGWDRDKPDKQTPERLEGADALADLWAYLNSIPTVRFPARWLALGPKAGPLRTQAMLMRVIDMDHMNQPLLVAFPGGPGTKAAIGVAKEFSEDIEIRIVADGMEARK